MNIDIRCGDCLKILDSLPRESVDLVVTDPPYGINYKTRRRKDKNHDFCSPIANDDTLEIAEEMIKKVYGVMKPNSGIYVFASPKNSYGIEQALIASGFKIKNHIVWKKNNWTAGDLKCSFGNQWELILYAIKGRNPIRGKRISDVWEFDRVAGKKQVHQNQKPVDLLKQCIEKSSDKRGLVLDPFMGSGSTGVACKELDRNFIGIELNQDYFNIAKQRLN